MQRSRQGSTGDSWGPSRLEYGPIYEKKLDVGVNEKGEIQCHGKLDMQETTEMAVHTLGS